MAFVYYFREENALSSGGALYLDLSTGVATNQAARLLPGYQPIQVYAVSLELLATVAMVTKPTVRAYYSSVAGGTSANWTALATFALTSTAITTPTVYYKDGLNQVVKPGTEILFRVDTTATQAAATVARVYYYPMRQDPAQNSAMLATG